MIEYTAPKKRDAIIKLAMLLAIISLAFFLYLAMTPRVVEAVSGNDWQSGRIIDDDIFYNSGSMSVQEIQAFLNQKVPNCDTNGTQIATDKGSKLTHAQYAASQGWAGPAYVCLKDYYQVPRSDQNINNIGSNVIPAGAIGSAQIIKNAATTYGVSPQALLVLLEKESDNLLKDTWPVASQYRNAMGYGCPDTAGCDPKYEGFYNQMSNAARQFKLYKDNPSAYRYKNQQDNVIKWAPDQLIGGSYVNVCGSSTVRITTQATAGLYNYTPYQPNRAALNNLYGTGDSCSAYGNRNFWRIFNDWFGGTQGSTYYSCKDSSNIIGSDSGRTIVRDRQGSSDQLALVFSNNTGSSCAEVHTWGDNALQSWRRHTATNSPSFNPDNSNIISGYVSRDSNRLHKIDYRATASGSVEIHTWDTDAQRWIAHIALPLTSLNPDDSEIITADTNNDGVSEFYLIQYRNTGSGKVEVHGLSSDFKGWNSHIATNINALDPSKGKIIAYDSTGDGRDEFFYLMMTDTGSGKVEVHGLSSDFKGWVLHIATNLPSNDFNVQNDGFASSDMNGDGKADLIHVKYSGTASSKVEIHVWSSDLQSWILHIATSSPSV